MTEVADSNRRVTFTHEAHPSFTPESAEKPLVKKKSSLKTSSQKRAGGSVSFHETVTVRELPSEEADDAVHTRKGPWEAAPEHDELWDGHTKDFWEEEKTLEEVRRIVVVRQMRMALEYNLGYAFYAMVANFKKRRQPAEDPSVSEILGLDDVAPQFDSPSAEETAIRKEIRELFADSVKGLDFPDLVQDRESFDKLYASTVINISDSKRMPGLGLLRVEELVDEIMNTEDICRMLGVQYVKPEVPKPNKAELEAQEKINNAVDVMEKRRGDRRASLEATNHPGVPPFGERRASVEAKRRASIDPQSVPHGVSGEPQSSPRNLRRPSLQQQQQQLAIDISNVRRASLLGTQSHAILPGEEGRRSSLTMKAEEPRRASFTTNDPNAPRRGSLIQKDASAGSKFVEQVIPSSETPTPAKRASLTKPGAEVVMEKRASLTPIVPTGIEDEDDQPIFAGGGRAAVRHGHINMISPKNSNKASHHVHIAEPSVASAADKVEGNEVRPLMEKTTGLSFYIHVLLGFFMVLILESQRSFHVTSAKEFRTSLKGAGPWVLLVPLGIVTILNVFYASYR